MSHASPPAHIIWSRRCSGSALLHGLLQPHVPWTDLGLAPFSPGQPLEAVVQLFEVDPAAAQSRLRSDWGGGRFFVHLWDTQSRDFNAWLLGQLAELGCGLVHLVRQATTERLFALALGQQAQVWDKPACDALRERLRHGEAAPPLSDALLRHMVQQELAAGERMDALLATQPQRLTLALEALTRSGLAALAEVDALFARLGLGQRQALLDDASLLQALWQADDHSAGLRQYDTALAAAWDRIDTLAHATIHIPAPTAPGDAIPQPDTGETDESS